MIKSILSLGHPALRSVCEKVSDPKAPEIADLINDLHDTLADARATTGYGRGIAAPQIGVLKRVVYLNIPGLSPMPLINPEIKWKSDETIIVWDACLSFLSIFMKVRRHKEIIVKYQDLSGEWHELRAGTEHDLSELLQHELDHLDGILSVDRVVDSRSFCSKEEFELRYRDDSPYVVPPAQSRRIAAQKTNRFKREPVSV